MPAFQSWNESRTAFVQAARWFAATTRLVADRWDEPGLGEWDIRALTGHTSRALLTVETYLARPAAAVELRSPAEYIVATHDAAGGGAVTDRGRQAGLALGDDPSQTVSEIAGRVTRLLAPCAGTELVDTLVGGMRLRDYLPTRTFELVVHTSDICRALGIPANPPKDAARQALSLISELALEREGASELLLAATGRTQLPEGFTVL